MKKNTGITLVALVITIIILLILAGAAISMITGGEGLFAQANGAATKYNQAAKNEADLINQLLNGNYLNNSGNGEGEEAEQSYVGYYADLDPEDGKIDGIIFADLAVGGSGQWGEEYPEYGAYTIPVKTGLKEYYVNEESYTVEGFGSKPVITAKAGSEGEDRFYIMALEDFETGGLWYNYAYGKMEDYAETTSVEFGKGKENTAKMIEYWNNKTYGGQCDSDIWGVIQGKVNEGWFVPSRAELAAFAQALEITSTNYADYGLTYANWSSSQYNEEMAWRAYFDGFYMHGAYVDCGFGSKNGNMGSWSTHFGYVRLATTF